MIRKHTRRAAKAAFAISLGVAILIGLFAAAFARPAQSATPTIVLGTKNFGEEYILGQLYKQALEAKGFKVSYKENIGSTELIQTSLTSGKIIRTYVEALPMQDRIKGAWRMFIDYEPDPAKPADLRAALQLRGVALTETFVTTVRP